MGTKTYYLIINYRLPCSETTNEYIFESYRDRRDALRDMRRLVASELPNHGAVHQSYDIVRFIHIDRAELS